MPAKKLKLPRAKIIFVSPFVIDTAQPTKRQIPAQLPCVLVPCATVKQARQVVKMHGPQFESYVRKNLENHAYTPGGITLVLDTIKQALNLPTP